MSAVIVNYRVLSNRYCQFVKDIFPIKLSKRYFSAVSCSRELEKKKQVFRLGIHYNYATENLQKVTNYDNSDSPIRSKVIHSSGKQKDTLEDILRKYPEKVKSISKIIQRPEEASCALFLKFPFLKKVNVENFEAKFSTLLGAGIDKEELLHDLWILSYSLETLKEKLEELKKMNFEGMKPWHLRCMKKIFHKLSRNKEINKVALRPYQSVNDYICKRLELTEPQVLGFARKHPPVMRVKVAKLKEVIDYLFDEGFTANHIYSTPRILCHSLKTTQKRLGILRAHKYEPYTLYHLCKTEKNFAIFVANLKNKQL